jgi:hypothetical protein
MLSLILTTVIATTSPAPAARTLDVSAAPIQVTAFMTEDHADPKNSNDPQTQQPDPHPARRQFTD